MSHKKMETTELMTQEFSYQQLVDYITNLSANNYLGWLHFPHQKVHHSKTCAIYKIFVNDFDMCLYVKVYAYPKWSSIRKILFRGGLIGSSRAKVEYQNLRHLYNKNIAPEPLFFQEKRRYLFLRCSFVIMKEIVDSVRMDHYIFSYWNQISLLQRRNFVEALALVTRKMNQGGFANGTFHWRNILVVQKGNDFNFYVIDSSTSKLRDSIFPYVDLASLDVYTDRFFSPQQRLRFFKIYFGICKLTIHHKKLIYRILKRKKNIAKQEYRKYQRHEKQLMDKEKNSSGTSKKHCEKEVNAGYEKMENIECYATKKFSSCQYSCTCYREIKLVKRFMDQISPVGSVIDIPCGTGCFQKVLTKYTKNLTQADYSPQMLAKAQSNMKENFPDTFNLDRFLQTSIFNISCSDNSFDIVFAMYVYHCFDQSMERIDLLRELKRVGKKWIIISFFNAHSFLHLQRTIKGKYKKKSYSCAITIKQFKKEIGRAGLELYSYYSNLRFYSEQTIALLKIIDE